MGGCFSGLTDGSTEAKPRTNSNGGGSPVAAPRGSLACGGREAARGEIDTIRRGCMALSQMDLPPDVGLILLSMRRHLRDLESMIEGPQKRATIGGEIGQSSLKEQVEWSVRCPGAGALLKTLICEAATGEFPSQWYTGRLYISETGCLFQSGVALEDTEFCTGLLEWDDVLNLQPHTLEAGVAEVELAIFEEADVEFCQLHLRLGVAKDLKWLLEAWKVCKGMQEHMDVASDEPPSAELDTSMTRTGVRRGTIRAGRRETVRVSRFSKTMDQGAIRLVTQWAEIEKMCSVSRMQSRTARDAITNMGDWESFDIFSLVKTTQQPLALVGLSSLIRLGLLEDELKAPLKDVYKVVSAWEGGYRKEPAFHNAIHAADITQAVYHSLTTVGLAQYIPTLLQTSMCLASMFHDVGHPGVNNHFLIARKDALAIRYNDTSVLESMHCATGFELMRSSNVDLFANLGTDVAKAARKHIIGIIMATDMTFHHKGIQEVKEVVHRELQWEDAEMQTAVANSVVHCSDIGNPTRPWGIFCQWTDRVMEEFFTQAELERQLGLSFAGGLSRGHAPLDRNKPFNVPKFQMGFAKMVVLPLYQAVELIPSLEWKDRMAALTGNIDQLQAEGDVRAKELEALAEAEKEVEAQANQASPDSKANG